MLNDALTATAAYSPPLVKSEGQWKSIDIDGKEVPMVWPGSKDATTFDTGVPAETLQKAGTGSVEVPAGFVRSHFLDFAKRITGFVVFRRFILVYIGMSRVGWLAWTREKVSIGQLRRQAVFAPLKIRAHPLTGDGIWHPDARWI